MHPAVLTDCESVCECSSGFLLCVFKDTLLDLLCEAMASTVRQGKGFLVTGFPKNVKQAQEYEVKVSGFQE